jgi:hypothetical protein
MRWGQAVSWGPNQSRGAAAPYRVAQTHGVGHTHGTFMLGSVAAPKPGILGNNTLCIEPGAAFFLKCVPCGHEPQLFDAVTFGGRLLAAPSARMGRLCPPAKQRGAGSLAPPPSGDVSLPSGHIPAPAPAEGRRHRRGGRSGETGRLGAGAARASLCGAGAPGGVWVCQKLPSRFLRRGAVLIVIINGLSLLAH